MRRGKWDYLILEIFWAVFHVDPADVHARSNDSLAATINTMEPVEQIIFAVEKLLEKPDEVKRYI